MEYELFICIDEDNNLHSVSYEDKEKGYFSLTGTEYSNLTSETEGEEKARETLSSAEYWQDMGLLPTNLLPVLKANINFDEVAKDVLNNDGWENTNGEYQYFGELENESHYLNLVSCGQHDDWKDAKIKKWLIPEKDAKKLLELWQKYHLKESPEAHKEAQKIFEKNKEMKKRQRVLQIFNEVTKANGN